MPGCGMHVILFHPGMCKLFIVWLWGNNPYLGIKYCGNFISEEAAEAADSNWKNEMKFDFLL